MGLIFIVPPLMCLILIVTPIAVMAVISLVKRIFKSPFHPPAFRYEMDVSSRRRPDPLDELDEYLIKNGIEPFLRNEAAWAEWHKAAREKVQASIFTTLRQKQYDAACRAAPPPHKIVLTRRQTRYRQVNYQRSAYCVTVDDFTQHLKIQEIAERYNQLQAIGFEATLTKYHAKNQRRLMTPALREEIKRRDNYTCQRCGKQMFDGVGLQIDHIIPIAKSGKTVASNLQVLCSRCNGSKGGQSLAAIPTALRRKVHKRRPRYGRLRLPPWERLFCCFLHLWHDFVTAFFLRPRAN